MRTPIACFVVLVACVSAFAGQEQIGKGTAKSGAEVQVFATDGALRGAKFESKVVLETMANKGSKTPVKLRLTLLVTKTIGDDDDYRYTVHDKDGVALEERKMGIDPESKMIFNEKTRVRLLIPLDAAKVTISSRLR